MPPVVYGLRSGTTAFPNKAFITGAAAASTLLDTRDAEYASAAVAAPITVAAVAAVQALLDGAGTDVDDLLAVHAIAVVAVATAQYLVQHLSDDVAAVRVTVTAITRIILRRSRRCAGHGGDCDAARQKLRDCLHGFGPSRSRLAGNNARRPIWHRLSLRRCTGPEPAVCCG